MDFQIILDVTHDSTGFYAAHPEAVSLMQQIAGDVAYYLDDMQADTVPARFALSIVNFDPIRYARNPIPYTGYYLFSTGWYHGTDPNDIWSTGSPGQTFLKRNALPLEIYAIGTVRPHPDGDRSAFNTTGWSFESADTAWWTISRERFGPSPTGDCPPGQTECNYYYPSFYSVMKHELLHALAYEGHYPRWQHFVDVGCIDDSVVIKHTGGCTPLADQVHAWNPQLHMRFYNAGVELIDDFELRVMQAVGWKLRETTPFIPLAFGTTGLNPGRAGEAYSDRIAMIGGIFPFRFQVSSGSLPPGLILSPFTGEISGTPGATGTFSFSVTVNDYGIDNSISPNGVATPFQILIVTGSGPSAAEVAGLTALYNSTNGSAWSVNTNWLTDTVSTWYGVVVESSKVKSVILRENNLTGPIPPQIGNLTHLHTLDLWNNHLNGSIPPEIGNLTALQSLELSINELSGPIPGTVGNLTNLTFFSVWNNQLSGTILSTFGNLTNLYLLQLGANAFMGAIPPELGQLVNLQYLFMADNQLSGGLPSELGNLADLFQLDISYNQLRGSLPLSLQNLTSLNTFYFNETQLCEPPDSTFQAWLASITNLTSTGINCLMSVPIASRWNILSVPMLVADNHKSVLYPNAISNAFAYEGVYVVKDSLANGIGYWLKFDSAQTIPQTGMQILSLAVDVNEGWNIVGSLSEQIAATTITSNPPGIVTSQFFGYRASYFPSDSIYAGKAYWVKVSQAGQLTLSASGQASPSTWIKIVPTSELPPPPPTHIEYPASYIPHEFALGQNNPNPFNPSTTIRFSLPRREHVTLKVFDVNSREVATLVEGS